MHHWRACSCSRPKHIPSRSCTKSMAQAILTAHSSSPALKLLNSIRQPDTISGASASGEVPGMLSCAHCFEWYQPGTGAAAEDEKKAAQDAQTRLCWACAAAAEGNEGREKERVFQARPVLAAARQPARGCRRCRTAGWLRRTRTAPTRAAPWTPSSAPPRPDLRSLIINPCRCIDAPAGALRRHLGLTSYPW